jgi:DNA polymerase-3 subunit delta
MADPIQQLLANGVFPPALLLFGEEDLLVENAAQRVFAAVAEKDPSGLSTEVLDGDGLTLDAVLSIARSYPMMSDHRTLWVKHFEKVSVGRDRNTDRLSTYLADPMPTTFLLFTASIPAAAGIGAAMGKGDAAAKRKIKALKYPFNVLLSQTTWLEYPAMRSSQVSAWVRSRATEHGVEMSAQLADFLVARHGTVLRELDTEVQKLATFVGHHGEVTEDEVSALVGGSREYSVFELQRAIGTANVRLATTIIERMLETDRQELLIIAMLTRYFTTLYKLIDAQALRDRGAMASAAGIPPFAVGDHLDALQRLGPEAVERALAELRRAESLVKSTPIDARLLLQTVVLAVAGTHQPNATGRVGLDIFAT